MQNSILGIKNYLLKKNNKILKDSSINIISDFMEPLWQIKNNIE